MTADDAGTVPEAGSGPARAVPAPRHRYPRLHRWRAWRRSRPFWGGLLLVLGGLELVALPLASDLVHGAVKLVIYIGIGGVFGVLIGALLIVAGLVTWFNPTHKTFYSIAGVVLGIVSFPASNLGGFFLGMLLAIIGGSIAFAWTPLQETQAGEEPAAPEPALARRAGRRWHEAPGRAVPRRTAVHRRSHRAGRRACGRRRTGGTGSPDSDSDLRPDHLLHQLIAEPESVADRLHRATRADTVVRPHRHGARSNGRTHADRGPEHAGRPVGHAERIGLGGQPVVNGQSVAVRQPVGDRHGKPWR